jgi:hypothetical protein
VSHKPAWHGTQQEGCICTLLVGSMLLQLVQAHVLLPPASSSLGALPSPLGTHHWAPALGVLVSPSPVTSPVSSPRCTRCSGVCLIGLHPANGCLLWMSRRTKQCSLQGMSAMGLCSGSGCYEYRIS